MKFDDVDRSADFDLSLPVRGAWVEISTFADLLGSARSLPVRGAWVEIGALRHRRKRWDSSLPVRGAWVEITASMTLVDGTWVAPRAGSVG